jgi:hypothetical protein
MNKLLSRPLEVLKEKLIHGWLPHSVAINSTNTIRSNFVYIGTHVSLLLSGIGFLFLQQYIWAINIARQGYGPYQSTSYLETVSALIVIVDAIILRWAFNGSKADRYDSLIWPIMFFGITLLILMANNA